MDYSQIPHDHEHPAGPSPWVTSPPSTSRTTSFGASTLQSGDSSPVATSTTYSERRSQRSDAGSDDETLTNDNNGFAGSQGDRSLLQPPNRDDSPDLSTRLQSPTFAEQQYLNQQHQQQQFQQQYLGQQQRQASYQQQKPVPSRYNTGARSGPRQNVPQYKLTAKITGLERTGRKDPILRFDVHASLNTNSSFLHG